MNHPLVVQIYQSLGNILKLSSQGVIVISDERNKQKPKPYKLKPIHIPVLLDVLVDVFIYHPLRYHCELVVSHRHS